MRAWLLIALFVIAGSIAAKADTIGRQSAAGGQSRNVFAYHQELAAVSAPTIVATVRSAGLDPATLPVKIGSNYVMRAVNKRGTKFRVVLAANTGEILAIRSTAAAKPEAVNKPSENSRAKPRSASSPAAVAPTVSMAHRQPSASVSPLPMQILPRIATYEHKIASAESAAALPIRLASNEHVETRVPAMLLGTLRSVGLTPATAPVKVEPTYVVQAVNQRGMTLRVLLAGNSGDILAIQPTRGPPRPEHHLGDALGATDSAKTSGPPTSTQSRLPATNDSSFIAP